MESPFVRQVWEQYAVTTRLLLRPSGKILLSTIAENKDFLLEILDCRPVSFRPSIPNLPYQYNFFTNYESEGLSSLNPEVPED